MKASSLVNYLSDLSYIKNPADPESYELTRISDVHSIEEGTVFFCGNKKFWEQIKNSSTRNLILILSRKFYEDEKEELTKEFDEFYACASVENLPLSMSFLSKPFYDQITSEENDEVDGRQLGTAKVHPSAILAQNVFLGANVTIEKDVKIYPGCVISSNCTIGAGTILFPNVTLMPRTSLGKECRIHSGTVIGADGFGYNFKDGVHHKVWHVGGVQVGDQVEMGASCTIDQGTFSPTVIGSGSKLDNQIQVAHNVRLGTGVIFCGQSGISGSSTVGDFTLVGGKAAISNDCHVGTACQIGGFAGVMGNVKDGEAVAGFPARPVKEWLKGMAQLRKLALKK